jgi:hypothetical protein
MMARVGGRGLVRRAILVAVVLLHLGDGRQSSKWRIKSEGGGKGQKSNEVLDIFVEGWDREMKILVGVVRNGENAKSGNAEERKVREKSVL